MNSLLTTRSQLSSSPYDRVVKGLEDGRKFLRQGIELDEKFDDSNKRQKIHACEMYKKGIDCFKAAMKVNIMDIPETKRAEVADMKAKAKSNLVAAEDRFVFLTNLYLAEKTPSPTEARPSTSTFRATPAEVRPTRMTKTRADLLKGVDAKFGNAILDEILDKTEVSLNDVYGCETAKQALEEAVIYPALNPSLFSGLRQPVKGILLFGPPGNGKTLLAKAVATESKQAFFNISASSLTSKWVGEGEKTVKALFQIARNAQPSIIFVDEIDSILCDRSEKEAESSRRLKTEFLIQFDGASSSENDRILVIGATNRPHELDDAILRRFPKRIILGLPDEKTRFLIIYNTLKKHNAEKGIKEHDLRYIASKTKGYSNSDLVNLCKEAAMVPVRRLGKDKLITTTQNGIRSLQVSDFEEALQVIKPSTNANHLEKMKDFASHSGQY